MFDKKIFITVFAAIILALFAYQKFKAVRYKQAAHITNGLAAASAVKTQVVEYYLTLGKFPSSNKDVGLPSPDEYSNESLVSLEILEGGIISLIFNSRTGVNNGIIQLKPSTKDHKKLSWECTSPSYRKIREIFPQCKFEY